MLKKNQIKDYFNLFFEKFNKSLDLNKLKLIIRKLEQNKSNKIFIFGNGGSAAIADHFAIDMNKNTKFNVINFSDNTLITCFSNDYGYENWMKKCLIKHGNPDDVLIVISSSGESINIINACKAAKQKKFKFILSFTGFKKNNSVSKLSNYNFWVDSKNYNIIENCHQILILFIADFFSKKIKLI